MSYHPTAKRPRHNRLQIKASRFFKSRSLEQLTVYIWFAQVVLSIAVTLT